MRDSLSGPFCPYILAKITNAITIIAPLPHFRFWRWGSETGGAVGLQLDISRDYCTLITVNKIKVLPMQTDNSDLILSFQMTHFD